MIPPVLAAAFGVGLVAGDRSGAGRRPFVRRRAARAVDRPILRCAGQAVDLNAWTGLRMASARCGRRGLLSDAANAIDGVDGPTNGIALCQGGSGYSHPRGAIHGTAYHDRPRSGQEWQKMTYSMRKVRLFRARRDVHCDGDPSRRRSVEETLFGLGDAGSAHRRPEGHRPRLGSCAWRGVVAQLMPEA